MPLFDDLEIAVIADIARRVRKTMTYTRTAELMAMDMRKLGYSPNKIRTEVAKLLRESPEYIKAVEQNTIDYKKEVKDIIADIVAKAKEEGNGIVANSGDMAWIDDMRVWESNGVPIKDDSFLPMLVRGIQKQVGDEILNLSKTTGFKGLYGFESIENMYRRELNSAVMQISSGTFSADAVVRKVIHELAQSGLRSIDYGSGRSLQLDSAVKLAVRTGCAQLSAKITDENIQRTEQNLVQVSSHWGARNKGVGIMNHEEWQGKVYYIKNEHDLAEEAQRIGQTSIDDLWEKTGYSVDGEHENNPLGLYGYNCRHRLYPFFEGVSEPIKFPQEPNPKEVDGKTYDYYAQTQRMRVLERRVRALKREKEALKLYGADKEELYRMDQKISNATDEYKEFCKAVGMKPSAPNLRYEVGSSDLHKTKAYKDYLKAQDLAVPKTKNTMDIKYAEKLEPNSNRDVLINQIELYKDNVEIAKDENSKHPYRYSPEEDKIYYNPGAKDYNRYDRDVVLTHEASHRYDALNNWPSQNMEFVDAIQSAKDIVIQNEEELAKYADDNPGDVFFNDIMAMIANGKARSFRGQGHKKASADVRYKEIFADIATIEYHNFDSREILNKYFGDLVGTFWRLL